MEFEWDDTKRLSNIEKHGLDFVDAEIVFAGPLLAATAKSIDGESRGLAVGTLDDVHVTMIYTVRGSAIRIISMRRARHEERKKYQDALRDSTESDSNPDKESE